ncbi:polysaccharide deacetylase family protein [Pseudoalteromonas luteoviolacea]|uniref:polysaccharide deacetylase family protein n=1 Tax=Pseudoalteromonas luteoviolacea TaxID=43657 RepID=UPI001B371F5F|nr:polysaccharide deacetylase family protein [Pseudoalteromonas luteoviolacea]MBQ4811489.1 polysaccharide deacetylase family protein [Pseudoalteromonas luteoviolacea]
MKAKALLGTWIGLLFCVFAESKEIALTFDDAPLPGSSLMSGEEKTHRIIQGLQGQQVDDALFFVTTGNIQDEQGAQRIKAYTRAGFHLGHHSHRHMSLNKSSSSDYLQDFDQSHSILQGYNNVLKLHRFPFLHYGETKEKRDQIKTGLEKYEYQIGYVTVDNFDWYLNSKLLEAVNSKQTINYDNLKKVYVDTIWRSIEFYDQVATQYLKKEVKHVLLLHENELAALFIGDLVAHIKSKGWKIISPSKAFTDPVLAKYHTSLNFNKQGRVAALAHFEGAEKALLRSEMENTQYLDDLLKRNDVFK